MEKPPGPAPFQSPARCCVVRCGRSSPPQVRLVLFNQSQGGSQPIPSSLSLTQLTLPLQTLYLDARPRIQTGQTKQQRHPRRFTKYATIRRRYYVVVLLFHFPLCLITLPVKQNKEEKACTASAGPQLVVEGEAMSPRLAELRLTAQLQSQRSSHTPHTRSEVPPPGRRAETLYAQRAPGVKLLQNLTD